MSKLNISPDISLSSNFTRAKTWDYSQEVQVNIYGHYNIDYGCLDAEMSPSFIHVSYNINDRENEIIASF